LDAPKLDTRAVAPSELRSARPLRYPTYPYSTPHLNLGTRDRLMKRRRKRKRKRGKEGKD